jgi:hypothetical protein
LRKKLKASNGNISLWRPLIKGIPAKPHSLEHSPVEVNIYSKKLCNYINSSDEKNKVPQCGC